MLLVTRSWLVKPSRNSQRGALGWATLPLLPQLVEIMSKQKIIVAAGTSVLVSAAAFMLYLPYSAMGQQRREQVENQEIERPQKASPGSVRGWADSIIIFQLRFALWRSSFSNVFLLWSRSSPLGIWTSTSTSNKSNTWLGRLASYEVHKCLRICILVYIPHAKCAHGRISQCISSEQLDEKRRIRCSSYTKRRLDFESTSYFFFSICP